MKRPEYNNAWPEEVKRIYEHDLREIWDPTIAPQVWNQYHNQLDLYLRIAESDQPLKILDVGCAQGTLALKLAEADHSVTAIDLRQDFLDYARSRYTHGDIEFIQGNALELELAHKFDLIFANQIIEHLVYPLEFVSGLKGILKPGGRLVITTPNGHYLKNQLPSFSDLGEPEQWEHLQYTADGDGHFFAYLDEELVDVFVQSGLTNLQVSYFETPWISGHMKARYLHPVLPVSLLRKLDSISLKIPSLNKKISHQLMIAGKN